MNKFSGTTQQCWDHFRTNRTNPEKGPQLDALTESFFGTQYLTSEIFLTWISSSQLPVGREIILLRYFLSELGYDVAELNSLEPVIREFGKLIACSVISFEDAKKLLGLQDSDSLLRILRGQRQTSQKKKDLMSTLLKRHSTNSPATTTGHNEIVYLFLHAVKGMIPLARLIVSDEFSPTERAELRKMEEGNIIFELSNLLAGACTETARNRLIHETKTERR